MKKYLLLIVTSLLMMACGDGIKEEAVGMFLLPGVNYGDDIHELIDKNVVQVKHISTEGKHYALNATLYGYDFSEDALGVETENEKVIDVLFGVQIPYEIFVGEEMPPAIKMAMALEDKLTEEMGTPTKIQNLNFMFKTEQTRIVWKKNGLKCELSIYPMPNNKFWQIDYWAHIDKDNN